MKTLSLLPSGGVSDVSDPPPAYPPIRSHVIGGFVVIGLMFGGFGLWATTAPLTSAVMAPGVVKVDSNRKTVQHLDGGIIHEILVHEGDKVRKDQILVRLDGLDAESDRAAAQDQIDALLASEARLVSQRDGRDSIVFPTALVTRSAQPAVAEAIAGQARIFADQSQALRAQIEVWEQRIAQYQAQISAQGSQIVAIELQLPSLREELDDAQKLLNKGYGLKSRALGLERQVAANLGEIEATRARIESLRQQIAEAKAQIETLRLSQVKTASEELREVQTKRSELEKISTKIGARAERRDILAPEDGVVMNLRYFAPGGVVAPGGAILDLVPTEDKMVLDVKIQPLDIDVVRPGLPATVRLVAFKQRVTPTLEGTLMRVSADTVTEDRTGAPYFTATVEVRPDQLQQLPNVKLYPGMPVDVAIVTGERTLFEYLFQPFADSFAYAFRED